jgi:hypothetical protein
MAGLTAIREAGARAEPPGPEAPLAARRLGGAAAMGRFGDGGMGRSGAAAALAQFNESETMDKARLALWMGGGALSLLLCAGVAWWGYKLVLREVLGVPVVEAGEGPMRIAPAEPGGMVAPHQGLAVNEVAAQEPSEPSDVLLLAPPTPGLAPEDMALAPGAAEAAAPSPEVATAGVTLTATPLPPAPGGRAMTPDEVLALADSIAAGAAPLAALSFDGIAPPPAAAAAGPAVIPASVPGVAVSLRPPSRPASALAGVSATAVSAETAPAQIALTADIPAGTALVQLGAFDSPEIAAAEWDRLQGVFGDFLSGRERVIQEAESGGRTFFRLRAMGFADLADARRLCAALTAEEAGCIPVVVR